MRRSSRPGKSGASHAPQAQHDAVGLQAPAVVEDDRRAVGARLGEHELGAGRHGLRGERLDRLAGAQDPGLGLEEREAHVVDGDAREQLASRRRARTGSPRRAGRPRPRPPSRRRGARARPRPSRRRGAGSISCHSAQARRAERVCQRVGAVAGADDARLVARARRARGRAPRARRARRPSRPARSDGPATRRTRRRRRPRARDGCSPPAG